MELARGASVTLCTVVVVATVAAQMVPPFAHAARWIALTGAFWMAIIDYSLRDGDAEMALRLVAGLALSAALAHLGWALLHLDHSLAHPRALLNPAVGQSVLFAPLGLIALAPRGRSERERYLAAAVGSLPRAFAVARFGCLGSGCCHGIAGSFGTHPTRLYEIVGLLGLAACTRRLPAEWAAPVTLSGFGALRLGIEPFRAPPPLGEPVLAPSALAIGWIATGLAMAVAASRRSGPVVGTP